VRGSAAAIRSCMSPGRPRAVSPIVVAPRGMLRACAWRSRGPSCGRLRSRSGSEAGPHARVLDLGTEPDLRDRAQRMRCSPAWAVLSTRRDKARNCCSGRPNARRSRRIPERRRARATSRRRRWLTSSHVRRPGQLLGMKRTPLRPRELLLRR
jgi:hypothetical protein